MSVIHSTKEERPQLSWGQRRELPGIEFCPRNTRKAGDLSRPLAGYPGKARDRSVLSGLTSYMSTSLIRNRHPLGPYSSPMPRDIWWP